VPRCVSRSAPHDCTAVTAASVRMISDVVEEVRQSAVGRKRQKRMIPVELLQTAGQAEQQVPSSASASCERQSKWPSESYSHASVSHKAAEHQRQSQYCDRPYAACCLAALLSATGMRMAASSSPATSQAGATHPSLSFALLPVALHWHAAASKCVKRHKRPAKLSGGSAWAGALTAPAPQDELLQPAWA